MRRTTGSALGGFFVHGGIPLSEYGRFLLWSVLGNAVGGIDSSIR